MNIGRLSLLALPFCFVTTTAGAAFQTLPTTGATISGSTIELFDILRIAPGATQGPINSINQYALPSQFNLLASQAFSVLVDGSAIGQTAGVSYNVGTFNDYVLLDTSVNKLVLTTRVNLNLTVAGVQNVFEVNNILRRGFDGFAVEAAWGRASDDDLRMYNAARSATLFGQGTRTYDADTVIMQTDLNVTEGNPWSGYFYLRTNAAYYTTEAGAASLYQAGEEGQPVVLQSYSAFVASAAIFLDSDNDGVSNTAEGTAATNPNSNDSDADGIRDGVELGLTTGVADNDGTYGANQGTDLAFFVADADATTTTNPLLADTDGDGLNDGQEDINFNGRVDAGESNPNDANSPAPQQVPVPAFALLALGLLLSRSAARRLRA